MIKVTLNNLSTYALSDYCKTSSASKTATVHLESGLALHNIYLMTHTNVRFSYENYYWMDEPFVHDHSGKAGIVDSWALTLYLDGP